MIEVKDLSYVYENGEGETLVLDKLSFEVREGEFVAVLGHNGSGKSTLAKLFNGVLMPTEGKVLVNGMDTTDEKNIYEIRRNVGMVFQNPDNQIVATVVEEDVAFGPENLGVPHEQLRERVDNALRAVNMYEHRKKAPHLLSGGQKQRVAIAGVIAMQPSYIVLDEPTAMLDPSGRREVMDTIRDLNRKLGITVILITHYMDEAAKADRVIVMDDGKILMDAPPAEVFLQNEALKAVGLDVPQVSELMYRLNKECPEVSSKITRVEECTDELLRVLGVECID
ncbi:MAG: energy-coupling factor transporter ATPase [Clostridia bacterium]|nr:energy-coupling factor transporter ATPase [Clostridia bacterium]